MSFNKLSKNQLLEFLNSYGINTRGHNSKNELAASANTLYETLLLFSPSLARLGVQPQYPTSIIDVYLARKYLESGKDIPNYTKKKIEELDQDTLELISQALTLDVNDPNLKDRVLKILDLIGSFDKPYDNQQEFLEKEKEEIKAECQNKLDAVNTDLMEIIGRTSSGQIIKALSDDEDLIVFVIGNSSEPENQFNYTIDYIGNLYRESIAVRNIVDAEYSEFGRLGSATYSDTLRVVYETSDEDEIEEIIFYGEFPVGVQVKVSRESLAIANHILDVVDLNNAKFYTPDGELIYFNDIYDYLSHNVDYKIEYNNTKKSGGRSEVIGTAEISLSVMAPSNQIEEIEDNI